MKAIESYLKGKKVIMRVARSAEQDVVYDWFEKNMPIMLGNENFLILKGLSLM